MRVLVAMSGGVDSSVAAARLLSGGHDVVGVTLKLWGGRSDSGCCSVADVDDARRVADHLGIVHHVFAETEVFDEHVVGPYVAAHVGGWTPNPCVECNRHVKFGSLLERARRMGFDALATGHHACVTIRASRDPDAAASGTNRYELRRGRDLSKDQSYVLSMLTQDELQSIVLPIGEMTKDEVRTEAARLGLRTATKPDSQEVCFIARADGGRRRFLADRVSMHEGLVVDGQTGGTIGTVEAVELVTVGQRRGFQVGGSPERRYAVAVDVPGRRVVVGTAEALLTSTTSLSGITWVAQPSDPGSPVLVQVSAHGRTRRATWQGDAVAYDEPERRVAPGQTVSLYDPADPDVVLGSAIAQPPHPR